MIILRSPVRISFGGGGTDMSTYYEKHEGAVLNTSIDKYFYTILTPKNDNTKQIISADFRSSLNNFDLYNSEKFKGLEIPNAVFKYFNIKNGLDLFMASQIPPGSGLGSSGAVTVNITALCYHLQNKPLNKKEIAETAYHIQKNILNLPIGKQDEYASSVGGLNFIKFQKNKVSIQEINIKQDTKKELENNLLLFFTGKTRQASKILIKQSASAKNDNSKTTEAMHKIKENAYQMKEALKNNKLNNFGKLLHQTWLNKKQMSQGISDPKLDKIYNEALNSGALGGKITGAGGGGYFLFFCPQKDQNKLTKKMINLGLNNLNFSFNNKGVEFIKK